MVVEPPPKDQNNDKNKIAVEIELDTESREDIIEAYQELDPPTEEILQDTEADL